MVDEDEDDLVDLDDLEEEEEEEEDDELPLLVEEVCTGLVCTQKRRANNDSFLKASEREIFERSVGSLRKQLV